MNRVKIGRVAVFVGWPRVLRTCWMSDQGHLTYNEEDGGVLASIYKGVEPFNLVTARVKRWKYEHP